MNEQERLTISNKLHSSFPIIQAVIEDVQQGQVFWNGHNDHWILHKAGFSEVFLQEDDGLELADSIIENVELPRYFHIYSPPSALISILKSKTEIFNIRERNRIQMTYTESREKSKPKDLSKDEYTLTQVTQDNFDSLEVFKLDLANKFWNGKEEFIEKSLAVFLKDKKDNPISLCYAAAIAEEKAEIDVVTRDDHRGKGLAKAVVSSFNFNCTVKSIAPNWDCFSDNQASLATAISLGFTENKLYSLISMYRK
jgi:hypothetical protein